MTEADFVQNDSDELTDDDLDSVAGGALCACVMGGGKKGGKDGVCACVAYGQGSSNDGSDDRCYCALGGHGYSRN